MARARASRRTKAQATTALAGDVLFLDPEVAARISNLELVARLIVEGFMIGLHRSPYHGFSVEFSSYRKYSVGDDLRRVDWKVFGKTDRYYVKQYEEDTNLTCHLLLDCSGSMAFGKKFTYALRLCAALGYLMVKQSDAVGLLAFSDDTIEYVKPSARSVPLRSLFSAMSGLRPEGGTSFGKGLAGLAERLVRRGLVILVSDLLAPAEDVLDELSRFRHRRHELIVFQLLADEERNFPYRDQIEFVDMETGERLTTQASYVRQQYVGELNAHLERLRRGLRDIGIDLVELSTSDRLDAALVEYLARREEH